MNLLLLYSAEISGVEARITGERAKWVYETFRPKIGDNLVCGELNGLIGGADILAASHHEIVAKVSLTKTAPARIPAELIVGLSRPQTVKKVLHFAASAGLHTVRLVRCEGSEKSYLDSHLLRPDDLAAELDLGLSQGVDTVRPVVVIHETVAGCLAGFRSGACAESAVRLIGDCGETVKAPTASTATDSLSAFAVAVGPEKGFSGEELDQFIEVGGFTPVSLGPRQLRVEFAAAALVAKCL